MKGVIVAVVGSAFLGLLAHGIADSEIEAVRIMAGVALAVAILNLFE